MARCYVCNKLGHVAKNCRGRPSESHGQEIQQGQKDSGLQQVRSNTETQGRSDTSSSEDVLYWNLAAEDFIHIR